MEKPLFTVVIPVYNKLPHLERSVTSVLYQTYPHFELILVDDASTDGSSEKLTEFKDSRLKIYRRSTPGPGGYAARNLGITQAVGDWICFLDADDKWDLNVLQALHDFIIKDPEVELISWGWYLSSGYKKTLDKFSLQNGRNKVKYFTIEDFFYGPQPVWTGAVSIKKEILVKSGMFPEAKFKRGGDLDTWARCLWHSKKNVWLNSIKSYYYIDSVNMVTKTVDRDLMFIFSPFLLELLNHENSRLRRSIMHYQNHFLYILLNGHVYSGNKINYKILRRMNLNIQGVLLVIKLHLNKIKCSVNRFSTWYL